MCYPLILDPAHVLPSPRLRFSGGMRAVGHVVGLASGLVLRLLALMHVLRLLPLRVVPLRVVRLLPSRCLEPVATTSCAQQPVRRK